MAANPILDGVELQQVEGIEGDQNQVFKQHRVPALEGDFFQPLARRAVRIRLQGVLTGSKAGKSLETLRGKFRAAQPVTFVADITTATEVARVLIQDMEVRELAGKPERFEYAVTLVEYIGPSGAKGTAPSSPAAPLPPVNAGKLAVEVAAESQSRFDVRAVTVSVNGTREQGQPFSQSLSNRSSFAWTEDSFPPGQYSVSAVGTDPPMSGSADVVVRAAQTSRITVRLRASAPIARAFVVHFYFDKAFIEPGTRPVLEQVADYARSHPRERLAIIGHADLAGPAPYNQLLSERRAHSVFEYLTQRHRDSAQAEWDTLRRNDSWGRREYEAMLRDLGYFPCELEGDPQLTKAAVRVYQRDHGLTVDGMVGDDTWAALIRDYMCRTPLAVPDTQILCPGDIDEEHGRNWEGRGGEEPLRNTLDAWRPNRRTELIFVKAEDLDGGDWLVQPAEPETLLVRGSIQLDDGTPLGNTKYVLLAPDGEYMDGERRRGPTRGRPVLGSTAANGTFAYLDRPKGVGIYTLEIQGPFIARLRGERPEAAKGPYVWKRLDGASDFNVLAAMRSTSGSRIELVTQETVRC